MTDYRQISSKRRTKSQNLNVSCLVLQLYLLNPLKPGVKSTTSEWSISLLLTKLRIILEIWR